MLCRHITMLNFMSDSIFSKRSKPAKTFVDRYSKGSWCEKIKDKEFNSHQIVHKTIQREDDRGYQLDGKYQFDNFIV